jgi:sulfate adenylyltransferase subunit 1 (EFTu-like GTPase family)
MGGQEVQWRPVGELPARISSPPTSTTTATLTAAQTMEKIPFYVYFDPDVDVRRGDVLVDTEGRQLWVEAVTAPSVRIYLRAGCREWQTEPQETA